MSKSDKISKGLFPEQFSRLYDGHQGSQRRGLSRLWATGYCSISPIPLGHCWRNGSRGHPNGAYPALSDCTATAWTQIKSCHLPYLLFMKSFRQKIIKWHSAGTVHRSGIQGSPQVASHLGDIRLSTTWSRGLLPPPSPPPLDQRGILDRYRAFHPRMCISLECTWNVFKERLYVAPPNWPRQIEEDWNQTKNILWARCFERGNQL